MPRIRIRVNLPGLASTYVVLLYLAYVLTIFSYTRKQYAIKHFIPCDHDHECSPLTSTHILATVKSNYLSWHLFFDEQTSQKLDAQLRKMKQSGDYKTIMVVTLNKSNTYGQFVQLVDFAITRNIRKYGFINNEMYFFPDD